MSESRTRNSVVNATVSTVSKIVNVFLSFICRTIFIKTLGTEYLGVNGLFTNILTILSFAELGIGNAIIFKLYKPIANGNKERVKTLLHFYKKVYSYIGIFIICAGIIVIPFLDIVVKDAPNIKENICHIYILFLINTAISYFFTYKKSIVTGNQRDYIVNLVNLIATVLMNISQIVFLYLTHNYIMYLLLQISATILDNIVISIIANKMYPYITEKEYTKITKVEQTNIFSDVKSLLLYKFGHILSNGTDNIIISGFLGVSKVGLLSNYTTITNAITTLLATPFNSITSSIGNLNTIKENERKEKVFYQILLVSFIIYGYISITMTLLLNKFIVIWLGSEYLLDFNISIALGFNLYVEGMRYVNYTFRNTLGLFKKGRVVPLISSITNIIASLILVNYIGIFGVLISTGLSRLIIMTWYDPYLIHRDEFKTPFKRYYLTYSYYLVIEVITFLICYKIISFINLTGIIGFVVCGIVLTLIIGFIYLLAILKLREFKEIKNRFLNKKI